MSLAHQMGLSMRGRLRAGQEEWAHSTPGHSSSAPPQPKGNTRRRGYSWGKRCSGSPSTRRAGPRSLHSFPCSLLQPRVGVEQGPILPPGSVPNPRSGWVADNSPHCMTPGWRARPGQGQRPLSSGMSAAMCSQKPCTGHTCTRPATWVPQQVGYVCAHRAVGWGTLARRSHPMCVSLLRPAPATPAPESPPRGIPGRGTRAAGN